MRDKYIQTAESVTPGHPDKLCDAIADRVLDACLGHDPAARVACEVMATAGKIIVAGEITAKVLPDIAAIVCRTVREAGYGSDYEVEVATHDQSGDIAAAVHQDSQLGAGDQGVMYGYACSETAELLPLPVVLASRLTARLTGARTMGTIHGQGPDGKAQVSVEYQGGVPRRVAAVVVSCQHDADKDPAQLRNEITRHIVGTSSISLAPPQAAGLTHYAAPPLPTKSGRLCGGPVGTCSWGPHRNPAKRLRWGEEEGMERAESSPQAGTQQSGISSDEARYIAKNIVAAGLADKCTVSLAYAIGQAEPMAVDIELGPPQSRPSGFVGRGGARKRAQFSPQAETKLSGLCDDDDTSWCAEEALVKAVRNVFDLTPSGIIRTLGLDRPMFSRFCNYGHFTHQEVPWEQTDRAAALAEACGIKKRLAQ